MVIQQYRKLTQELAQKQKQVAEIEEILRNLTVSVDKTGKVDFSEYHKRMQKRDMLKAEIVILENTIKTLENIELPNSIKQDFDSKMEKQTKEIIDTIHNARQSTIDAVKKLKTLDFDTMYSKIDKAKKIAFQYYDSARDNKFFGNVHMEEQRNLFANFPGQIKLYIPDSERYATNSLRADFDDVAGSRKIGEHLKCSIFDLLSSDKLELILEVLFVEYEKKIRTVQEITSLLEIDPVKISETFIGQNDEQQAA